MAELLPPLADLHRHLDGSLRPTTLAELAAKQGVVLPEDLPFRRGMGLDDAIQAQVIAWGHEGAFPRR